MGLAVVIAYRAMGCGYSDPADVDMPLGPSRPRGIACLVLAAICWVI